MSSQLSAPQSQPEGPVNPLLAFLTAVQFLTVSPPFIQRAFTPGELGQATGFFPLVGVGIGGILIGADFILGKVFAPPVQAALLLAVWVLLSGALHLDGFLDACDGLLGGFTPESRMRILKDEHKGAFAVTAGILLLLVKFAALQSLNARLPALLLAPTLGRWSMTLAIAVFPYARAEGLGRAMKDHTKFLQVILATGIALVTAWIAGQSPGLFSLVLSGIVTWCVALFTLRRIPGLTGDIYGAINELVEVAVLLAFSTTWRG